jgi:hypothetical protein
MAVTYMPKGKGTEKSAESPDTPDPAALSSFKVRRKTAQTVMKLTALRGLPSIAAFFEEPDVEDFLTHLLLRELQKEQTNLTGRPPK